MFPYLKNNFNNPSFLLILNGNERRARVLNTDIQREAKQSHSITLYTKYTLNN